MENQFSRTELVIGCEGVNILKNSKVAIFGVGGVGSFAVEGLARAGVGNFLLVDSDVVSVSNINRQIIADYESVGKFKVEVAKNRILKINPKAKVEIRKDFFTVESEDFFDDSFDYIADCIDTVSGKIELVVRANSKGIPIISCMGTGNKLDPTRFEVTDIYKTSVCPLAKVMRKELKARKIKKLKVVFSKEEPIKNSAFDEKTHRKIPGSISFVPSVAGMIIAGEIVKDIVFKRIVKNEEFR